MRLTAVLEKGERQQDKLLEGEPTGEPFVPFEELKALTDSRKDTLEQVQDLNKRAQREW